MNFKKVDYVKILENSHKFFHKFKLNKKELRKADKKDVQIVKEILEFFYKKI